MPRTILDITRLLTRAGHPVATGVDRVEMAYARRVLTLGARGGFAAVVGRRVAPLDGARVAAFIGALDAKWRGGRGDDGAARRLADWLGAPAPASAVTPQAPDPVGRLALRLRAEAILSWRRPAVAAGDDYVHVSHLRLERREPYEAVARAGARLTILVHDLVPIRYPEYGRDGEAARHAGRMGTALDLATTLAAISTETARDLAAYAAETGRRPPEIVVAPIGIEARFDPAVPALPATTPYFVAVATIEPRKNHLVLLHVWRRLAARLGLDTPKLVLIGRRGWENEMILDLLDRAPAIRAHVIEVNDLPDAALVGLMKGARALLFPSFAEGYGLPLAEAMALGLPVIASDLPAFREIAGDAVDRIDPIDGPGWEAAIAAYAADPSPAREAALERLRGYAPPSWDAHFARLPARIGLG